MQQKVFAEKYISGLSMQIASEQNPETRQVLTQIALEAAELGGLGLKDTLQAITKGLRDSERAKRN